MSSRAIAQPPQVHVVENFLEASDHADLFADSFVSEADYWPSSLSAYNETEILSGT